MHTAEILEANQQDVVAAREAGVKEALIDRLALSPERIEGMAEGLRQIASLPDVIGDMLSAKKLPNGLLVGKRRVPLGVVGIIYESRPGVTSDAFALCFKAGNCTILRGGSDAIRSNCAIVKILKEALTFAEVSEHALSLIEDTSRETATQFMKMNAYVDVLIPRGGQGLIQNVINNATIPTIETGTGNCHIYVDYNADFEKAIAIAMNAKTQRVGVCNAAESLLVHKDIAEEFLPRLYEKMKEKSVIWRADENVCELMRGQTLIEEADEEDWGREYLDYKMSVGIVSSVEEAITHINRYNTGHSEAIITNDFMNAQKFQNEVDAACVYVNASTRFTDGFEFGLGGEIGISTQKLHARGPMGMEALTSIKYTILGDGQIRQ